MVKPLNKKNTKTQETTTESGPSVLVGYFGKPGTSEVIQCEPHAAPVGFIEIKNSISPSSYHVLDNAGDWILPDGVTYDKLRAEAYLKAWPTIKQLEAYHDSANGDTTKLEQMNADFAKIKALYPK